MDVILPTGHWQFALVYLEDIVTFLKNPEEPIKHMRHVLTLLCDDERTIKLKMCEMFSNIINYLGHFSYPGKLAVSQHTIDAISYLIPFSEYYRTSIVSGLV